MPAVVVAAIPHPRTGPGPGPGSCRRAVTAQVLALVQEWLARTTVPAARLVLVTAGAVAAGPGDGVADLAGAAAWGLVRSAQSENPGRPGPGRPARRRRGRRPGCWPRRWRSGEPELAIRDGTAYGRRLARPARRAWSRRRPARGGWRPPARARWTDLALVPCPQAAAPLGAGQVRVAVRAAGLNFRDVLIALGMYPGDRRCMGSEVAGVVLETGPGVTGLAAGDRVTGPGRRRVRAGRGDRRAAAGRRSRRLVVRPGRARCRSRSLTAWYALADLAGARPGQRLLVHAAAGGVGMAAVSHRPAPGPGGLRHRQPGQARRAGAPWAWTRRTSPPPATRSSSGRFLAATGGRGMDIVLNALAGELTDASLRLLPRGGRVHRDGQDRHPRPGRGRRRPPGRGLPGVRPGRGGPGPARADPRRRSWRCSRPGRWPPPPVRAWDVRRAPEAFRFMSQARHTGKIVLTIPPARPRPAAGTVLVTGGTGTLGALVARHLAATARAARTWCWPAGPGPAAPGAAALAAELAGAGAGVTIAALRRRRPRRAGRGCWPRSRPRPR